MLQPLGFVSFLIFSRTLQSPKKGRLPIQKNSCQAHENIDFTMSSVIANRGESDEEFARRLQSEDVVLSALMRQHRGGGDMSSIRASYSGEGGVRHTGTSSSGGEDEGLIANQRSSGEAAQNGAIQTFEGVNHQQQRLNELYMYVSILKSMYVCVVCIYVIYVLTPFLSLSFFPLKKAPH